MSEEKLTCTKIIRVNDGRDNQGKMLSYHKRCGLPASECEIGGLLTTAKAVLCDRCKREADRQAFVSEGGFTIDKKEESFQQRRMPGTGVKAQG